MNYYKLGCIWDAKSKQWQSYFNILRKHKLAIKGENGFKLGDVVAIAEGYSIKAIGIVRSQSYKLGGSEYESDFKHCIPEEEYSWIHYYRVEWIDISKNIIEYQTRQGWVQIQQPDIIQQIDEKINEYNNQKMTKEIVTLLEANKNLIFTGAPGVGKTYKTAEIAVALCDGSDGISSNRTDLMKRYRELIEQRQISFTTFHQSLDYEEFVEGLKPEVADDGQVIYEVKAGIFKHICERALKTTKTDGVDNFDEAWEKLIQLIKDNLAKGALTGIGSWKYGLSRNETLKYSSVDTSSQYAFTITKPNTYAAYRNEMARPSGGFQKDMEDIVKYMKAECNLKEYKTGVATNKDKNFILIIDEINRGNISKIFGELITLLEKDKRLGEENEITVTLPYSQETFGVPSNLYIIGTMNTADRSIGAIDYALRRRFAFYALKADKTIISNYGEYEGDTKAKAERLFDKIQDFIKKHINDDLDADDLMIGHSYFLCKTENDLKHRLEYEIIPLIWEYQKDGILGCERQTLKDNIEEWQNL
jgi:5-methylcytosine-specific restriction protein B